tara:strand:- start:1065 stop:1433 length:369 start_codon:yes stop_codon:yes gene_type:complete
MATLTAQNSTELGTTITMASADAGGDDFVNSGNQIIIIENEHSATSYNVTITGHIDTNVSNTYADPNYGELSKADTVKACAAGSITTIGPFKPAGFNNSAGKVLVTYSAVTDLKVAVVDIVG